MAAGGQRADDPRSWPVRRAVSAGGIVVRATPVGHEAALIRTTNLQGKQVWGLPKGTVEPGEDLTQTALREVQEETGLQAEIVEALDPVTYWFAWSPEQVRYRKTVHLFLMRSLGGDITHHDHEVEEVCFFPVREAAKVATHSSERKALRTAAEIVATW